MDIPFGLVLIPTSFIVTYNSINWQSRVVTEQAVLFYRAVTYASMYTRETRLYNIFLLSEVESTSKEASLHRCSKIENWNLNVSDISALSPHHKVISPYFLY